jgi:LacI family transcriptional regulator
VIVSDIRNPFFPEIVYAAEQEARRCGFLPILCDIAEEQADPYVEGLLDHGVDGLLVASAQPDDTSFVRLRSEGLPIVLVNRSHPAFPEAYVISDYRSGAALATRHLIELGHTKIAHIRGPLSVTASVERERGYVEELELAGIEYVRVVSADDFSPEAGRQAVFRLMQLKERPTAIFVVNDYCALGVLSGLSDLGLRVPTDIGVVGYDDIWLARLPSIGLTTVSSRMEDMGRIGAQMLIELMSGQKPTVAAVTLPPQLQVRGTTLLPSDTKV